MSVSQLGGDVERGAGRSGEVAMPHDAHPGEHPAEGVDDSAEGEALRLRAGVARRLAVVERPANVGYPYRAYVVAATVGSYRR